MEQSLCSFPMKKQPFSGLPGLVCVLPLAFRHIVREGICDTRGSTLGRADGNEEIVHLNSILLGGAVRKAVKDSVGRIVNNIHIIRLEPFILPHDGRVRVQDHHLLQFRAVRESVSGD